MSRFSLTTQKAELQVRLIGDRRLRVVPILYIQTFSQPCCKLIRYYSTGQEFNNKRVCELRPEAK